MIQESYDLNIRCHYCFRRLISALTPPGTAPYYVTQTRLAGEYGIATSDHRLARAHGGTNGVYNRVPCCQVCNWNKADRPYDVFYAETATIRALNQIHAALDILKQTVGVPLVGEGKPISGREYRAARWVLKRAAALHAQALSGQAVQDAR